MAELNIGVGISDTIKTLFTDGAFPVAEANDIKGGIHYIETRSSGGSPPTTFWQISALRRQLGMLVYVKDENKYYQLQHRNSGPFEPTDSSNFVELKIGGSGSDEWIDSVIGVYDDPSNIPASEKLSGNKFLVSGSGSGDFAGFNHRIATYEVSASNQFQGGFSFVLPPNGCTVRVDNDPTAIYRFSGTNSQTGKWEKELQNQIRYIYPTSSNGLTYSYTTVGQTRLVGYTNSIFFANFATANAGAVLLSIDGNEFRSIKKASSNTLVDLSANDFGAGIQYQLSYDSGVFQIALPTSGQGGTIGPAEDSTYEDGLFGDFTPSTPIGTAVDRFNEVLKALVPSGPPNLRSWSANGTFVNGKISYTNAEAVGLSYNPVVSPLGNAARGDLFSPGVPSGYRLGITNASTSISGILNSDVPESDQKPIKSYDANAFGNGMTGSIVLYINSSTASIVDLGSSLGQLSNPTIHGNLQVSAATSSKFPTGAPFANSFWRTGQYTILKSSSFIKKGYNQISIKHILPSTTISLDSYEFLIDDSTTDTILSGEALVYNLSGVRYLSGIAYYTGGSITYRSTAANIYRNTYYPLGDAGVFGDASTSAQSQSPIYNGRTYDTNLSGQIFTPSPSQILLPPPNNITGTVGDSYTFETTFSINPNSRKINGGSTFITIAKRTVRPTQTGGSAVASSLFIDNVTTASTDLIENFCSESYRLPNTNYTTKADVDSANWTSQSSLLTNPSYQNALQVADGRLLYPGFNFRTAGSLSTNPNFGSINVEYQDCGVNVLNAIRGGNSNGYRTYTRIFKFGSISYPRFAFDIDYKDTEFVSVGTSLVSSTTRVQIEFKLPYSSGSPFGGLVGGAVTGWLDATSSFLGGPLVDGAGCLSGNVPANGKDWKINFGQKETIFSAGYVLMRITAGKDWKGYIQKITMTPGKG